MAETLVNRARLVKVWAEVESLEGNHFTVRQVRAMDKGIQFVHELRALGVKCGYDFRFAGEHMSTRPQVKLMYAYARGLGWTPTTV